MHVNMYSINIVACTHVQYKHCTILMFSIHALVPIIFVWPICAIKIILLHICLISFPTTYLSYFLLNYLLSYLPSQLPTFPISYLTIPTFLPFFPTTYLSYFLLNYLLSYLSSQLPTFPTS